MAAEGTPFGRFVSAMPWNHFGRKNIGYLLALQLGACRIWDFDDDNALIISSLKRHVELTLQPIDGELLGLRPRVFGQRVVNPYTLFGPTSWLWPRGTPIEHVSSPDSIAGELVRMDRGKLSDIAVVQSAANGNPDVDAIFRLTRSTDITFSSTLSLAILSSGFSPYNAQAALHLKPGLWATYLPITVHGRVSDIWRSYCSQAVFRILGLHAAFSSAWVHHYRSPHDLVGDLRAEDDLYQLAGPLVDLLWEWSEVDREDECGLLLLLRAYVLLYEHCVLEAEDSFAFSLAGDSVSGHPRGCAH